MSFGAATGLDDESAVAHDTLGLVKQFLEWDWAGAEKEYRRAIELDPSFPEARFDYATLLLGAMGRPDGWREQMDRCIELDPLNQNLSPLSRPGVPSGAPVR